LCIPATPDKFKLAASLAMHWVSFCNNWRELLGAGEIRENGKFFAPILRYK
jgi:hypothetical protein